MTTTRFPDLLSEVRAFRAAHPDVRYVELICLDIPGHFYGKRYPLDMLEKVAAGGPLKVPQNCVLLGAQGGLHPIGDYCFNDGDPDAPRRLIPGTLKPVRWEKQPLGQMLISSDGTEAPIEFEPREVLARVLKRLQAKGIRPMVASELEFYLFDQSYESIHAQHYREPRTANYHIEDYGILQTIRDEPVLRAIRKHLQAAGIAVENSKGEWGPGQEEINVRYADALTMADSHSIIKHACKEIALLQGKAITFMAKWNYNLAGSSSHIHNSLWSLKGNKPLFFDAKAEFGMSKLMRQWVAGQLKYAGDITYFLAPYINSYKRFQAGTFAPTRAVWSNDNRTAGFRLCGEGGKGIRIECRIGGADLNPYLAFAALIAAGLAGIDEQLELPAPFSGDAYEHDELPEVAKTLRGATSALEQSRMLRAAFGDEVVEHYLHTARWEQLEYDRRVTDWELRRGFERY